jgi:hypothetical protein
MLSGRADSFDAWSSRRPSWELRLPRLSGVLNLNMAISDLDNREIGGRTKYRDGAWKMNHCWDKGPFLDRLHRHSDSSWHLSSAIPLDPIFWTGDEPDSAF